MCKALQIKYGLPPLTTAVISPDQVAAGGGTRACQALQPVDRQVGAELHQDRRLSLKVVWVGWWACLKMVHNLLTGSYGNEPGRRVDLFRTTVAGWPVRT